MKLYIANPSFFLLQIYIMRIPCLPQAVIVFKCVQYTTKHESDPEIFPVWADVIWWLIVAGAIISIPVWFLGYICYRGGARFDLLFVLILLFFSFHCSNVKIAKIDSIIRIANKVGGTFSPWRTPWTKHYSKYYIITTTDTIARKVTVCILFTPLLLIFNPLST